MATTLSLSKGCFVKNPKNSGKNRKRKANDFSESLSMTQRWESYQDMTDKIDKMMKLIQSEVHSKLFSELVTQCLGVTKDWSSNSLHYSLPAVALVTGVNLPDHKEIFSSMLETLRNNVSSHIATLNSRDCPSIKLMVKRMVTQLMNEEHADDDDDGDGSTHIKTRQCTFPVLVSWYENCVSAPKQQKSSPRKQKSDISIQPVVIILEDLESYTPNILQDFILMCSDYQHKIPLVVIFGVSTCVSAVHRLIPQSVSSKLAIEKLHVPLSVHYLNVVIEKLVMSNDIEFKLGGKTYQLLEEMFVFHDFCVKNFMKGLKFCLFEHFTSNEQSVLCCSMEKLQDRINSLSEDELQHFRKVPSFEVFLEKQTKEEQARLLVKDDHLKNVLINMLIDVISYHESFYPMVHCLHALTHDLPNSPFGKSVREVYSNCLNKNLLQSEEFETAMKLIQMLARGEMIEKLKKCSSVACQFKQQSLTTFAGTLENYAAQLENISNTTNNSITPAVEVKIKEGKSLAQLQQTVLGLRKKPTAFDALRFEIKNFIAGIFKDEMGHPYDLPMHEVFYFDSVSSVKKKLLGAPRASVQTALENPSSYLHCKCCRNTDIVDQSCPDICIAYKLHLESGRLINLYDWLQSFAMVVSTEDSSPNGKFKGRSQIDSVIQARFAQAVSELQFLGFIKPSGRKIDHVARLTWAH